MAKQEKIFCSFCGRPKSEVNMLIAGSDAHICDECAHKANYIVEEEMATKKKKNKSYLPQYNTKPKEIKEHLDRYVIGQEDAKKIMSVAVYNHFKRINYITQDQVELEKSNIILIGETGTGKTLMAKTIAKFLKVPFTIVDATVFTESGYVGEDVESILSRLLQVCNYDIALAEKGIVYIDEIDKISRKSDNPSITRDVNGEGVQQALLKLLEGSEVLVPPEGGRKHPDQKLVKINTSNILFICGGAFEGLDKIIAARMNRNKIGFSSQDKTEKVDSENMLQYVNPKDLKKYGMIPELLGRLPVLSYLNSLDRDTLYDILTQPQNALIRQYKALMDMEGIRLDFDREALDYVVDKALEYKLGARGLRSIMECILTDMMFEVPSDKSLKEFTVTLPYAQEKLTKSKFTHLQVA